MISHNSDGVNPDPPLCAANNPSQIVVGHRTASIVNSGTDKILPAEHSASITKGRAVSKKEPCPCCGKTDWCFLLDDGNAVVCGRTDAAPVGWKQTGTAKDGRAIFAKEDNSSYTQRSRGYSQTPIYTRSVKRVSPDQIQVVSNVKGDFPVWIDLRNSPDGAVERQIIYPYPDPSTGEPLGQVVRRQWSDRRPAYNERTKSIRPEHWVDSSDPKESKWVTGKGKQPWFLYREAEVREAIAHGEAVIFYVAGEQAVESCRQLGLTAFCNQGGEGVGIKQIESFLKTHPPQLLVIWADHDDQGEKTKIKLLKASEAAGVPAVAIDPLQIWAEMPSKGDITNVLEESGMEAPEIIHRLEVEIHRALRQRQQGSAAPEQERQKLPAAAAIAAELADQYRQQLAFDAHSSRFLHYEAELPGVWSGLPDIEIQAMIQVELDSRSQTSGKYGFSYLKSICELLKIYLRVKNWDEPVDLLPFRNGVLNLKTYDFLPHAPSYRLTWTLPRDYNPNATDWSRISEWMDEVTEGDATVKSILCCWLNACMKGRSDLQRFLHLTGPGGSGKGTFMRLCVALVGGMNVYSSTLADWCENRFETSNAHGKRLIVFWDQDKYRGGLSRFKSLTGGDLLRGEIKNKQPFQFIYTGMVMLSSNFPIFAGDSSSGMARRALILPFGRPVAPSKRRNLDAEFEPELAALTNYILSIPDEAVTQTLLQTVNPSSEVLKQTWENRIQENSIAAWLDEHIIFDADAKTQIGSDKAKEYTLFGSYWQYCDRIGTRPLAGSQFTPALLDLCQNILKLSVCKRRNNQCHYIIGLRLRTPNDVDIPVWQERIVTRCDEQHEGDEAVTGESVGIKPLSSLDCVGRDGESSFSQTLKLKQPNDRTLPSSKESNIPTLPITPINPAQNKDFSCDHDNQVMGDLPDTSMTSEPGGIQIGSQVRKRNKRGWRGRVCEIDGDWANVLWQFEKYPDRISLAELEPLEKE